ncbi:hypothetical protein [Natronospira bacteriovora]|uniref:ACR3 family arsenite efflux pump ArsB n=1 Tax=Natronospira bacteriovora TaxID=3069753 RepID=A0ABU0W9B1_9GAMM|nr:hypothetical protein [Natronospira sp. AB-CW4]MDQ2070015.1 hypothetical protein [Natronospira sp. AB-CW4]
MINWRQLEHWQVLPLMLAVLAGLLAGRAIPETVNPWSDAIWPLLAALLFTGFLHLDLRGWRRNLVDRRFLGLLALLNFLLLPGLTGLVLMLAPDSTPLRFAMALVLLAPCTDWFLGFNLLGRGNPERATAAIPILLGGQVLAIPLWLTLFFGPGELQDFGLERFAAVFIGLFLIPLALALAARQIGHRLPVIEPVINGLKRGGPILLFMPVIFLVVATELAVLDGRLMRQLSPLIPLLLLWIGLGLTLAWLLGRLGRLAIAARRTLLFNAASRNSFVVLPFALALPAGAEIAAAVIILQAMVELGVLSVLTGVVPRIIR